MIGLLLSIYNANLRLFINISKILLKIDIYANLIDVKTHDFLTLTIYVFMRIHCHSDNCRFGTVLDSIKSVMKTKFFIILSAWAALAAKAQQPWSMDQCMAYAAEHSTSVRQARWDLATATANRTEALGDFFPSISAQVGAQLNWGRNIDPETNTYNNVTTFNNGYGIYASMILFDGGQTFNRYKQARVERERNLNAVEMQRDDQAIATMMAYVDAVYYLNSIGITRDKLDQSKAVLTLVKRQEELGIKSIPDVAQAQSTVADDEYNLVRNTNLYTQSMLSLRSKMNFPSDEDLAVDSASAIASGEIFDDPESIFMSARASNPRAIDAELNVSAYKYLYRVAKGQLMPTISVNAGITTSYYKTITGGNSGPRFGEQIRNNRGEYVSATLSIPIFSGLSRVSAVKRAKYALERAKTSRDEQLRKLHDDITAAVTDCNGYAMEIKSLESKVESDKLAYTLNRRKYEEGLMSLIDLQLSANTYFASRVSLLQKQMLFLLKQKLVDYYKGNPLY